MGKMILITTDNEVKELEYSDGGLKSWKKLREHIGNGCELIEHVQPKRLYTEIGAGIEIKNVPGSKVSMLVDEEFYFHCDETKLNKIASWLYETDRHGYPILGNALIIGEKYGNAGKEDVIVPNPVTLRPYRTFLEVEQPESKFIFRIREGSDGQPMFKLVEADAGLWKYEAVDAIKKYLTENLPEELLKVITIIG